MTAEAKHFRTRAAFRRWLEKNHDKGSELWVLFYKKASDRGGMIYREAVEEALCFGWIDGIAKGIDEESYRQRFTPRKKGSAWSAVNIARIGELRAAGLMHESGLKVFEQRDPTKADLYSFEQGEVVFEPEMEKRFRAEKDAWDFWERQPPGYRRQAIWWVISAKKPETRDRRLATLIEDSAAGLRLKHLAPRK